MPPNVLKNQRVNLNGVQRFAQKLPGQSRPIFLTCVYGLGAGLAAVAFQAAMNGLYRLSLVDLSHQSRTVFLIGSFGVIVTTSLLVGYLLNSYCRAASGSGIPQLKVAFWKDFGVVPWRVVWVKFVAGVLSIGGGCSLGREGPSVQLAGGVASNLAGILGEPKQSRRLAAAAGAGAGLAAAFNTPLAAVVFVLEEIIGDLNSRLLGSVLLAFGHRRVGGSWVDWQAACVCARGRWVGGLVGLRFDAGGCGGWGVGWRFVSERDFGVARPAAAKQVCAGLGFDPRWAGW